jgi:hypothetical protein
MAQEGTVAQTPDELDAWISRHPNVQRSLQSGGYRAVFTAEDLLPLLQAMAVASDETKPRHSAKPAMSAPARVTILALVVAIAVGVLLGLLA